MFALFDAEFREIAAFAPLEDVRVEISPSPSIATNVSVSAAMLSPKTGLTLIASPSSSCESLIFEPMISVPTRESAIAGATKLSAESLP